MSKTNFEMYLDFANHSMMNDSEPLIFLIA